ncbi:MAG: hypothetical protein MR320_04135 [Enterococcus gallinarum]|nr:hypothetical protein [Enterococcus gallinarum]
MIAFATLVLLITDNKNQKK